jgi:hypothetical protein
VGVCIVGVGGGGGLLKERGGLVLSERKWYYRN